jgi:hypothetical protein
VSLEKKLATRAMTMSVELRMRFFKLGGSNSCACGYEEGDVLRNRYGEIGCRSAVVRVLVLVSSTRYFFGHARESHNASEPWPGPQRRTASWPASQDGRRLQQALRATNIIPVSMLVLIESLFFLSYHVSYSTAALLMGASLA